MRAVTLLVTAALTLVSCERERSAAPAPQPVAAGGAIAVDVGAEFAPASVSVPPNKPVQIAFRRSGASTCGDEVVFPDLGIRKKLPDNATTVVELPPQSPRTLHFTCGMNMMKGTVVVK